MLDSVLFPELPMVLTFPFSPKRGADDLNTLVNLLSSHTEPEMFQGFSSESAFKAFKRSVDLPYEHWAVVQTLSDLSYGQLSFNYVLACLLSRGIADLMAIAGEEHCDDFSTGEFSRQYNLYIIERLKSENKALFNTLKQVIMLSDESALEDDSNG